jgi:hypothetical protein
LKDLKQPLSVAGVVTSGVAIGLISFVLYRLGGVERGMSQVRNDLQIVLSKLRAEGDGLVDEPGTDPEFRFATVSDAESVVQRLGDRPLANRLAEAILAMDSWLIKPGEEERFKKYKLGQQSRLR